MGRFVAVVLCVALAFGLTACDPLVKTEHLSVTPHIEAAVPSSTEEISNSPSVVSHRMELRGAVLSFIRDWTEQGVIYVRNYSGDIAADLEETIHYATHEDPIGAYAVDYVDAELNGNGEEGSVNMSIVFRRSAAEIDAIVTVSSNTGAYDRIRQALSAFDVSLTLRIRNYQEADFARYIYDYCLDHPAIVPVIPNLSAQVYPEEGESRILELHFAYPVAREELRLIQSEVQTIWNSASSYVRSGKNAQEQAQLLCRFLSTRFSYSITDTFPQMPAYELLCRGKAHSYSFASVFYAQCLSVGLDCELVSGSRNDAPHYWNLLQIDGQYYHIDLLRSLEQGQTELLLLTSQELIQEGYSWQPEAYPPAVEAPAVDEEVPGASQPEQDNAPETEQTTESGPQPSETEPPLPAESTGDTTGTESAPSEESSGESAQDPT